LFQEKLHLAVEERNFLEDSSKCVIGDLFEEMSMLEWAGIGIGEEETF